MDNKYHEINIFIKTLKGHSSVLTKQQLSTLKGQAIAGDLTGAKKGFKKLILQ
jgi:hypothetical protein